MFRHFIKISLRILIRRRVYSLISLLGLIIAFAASFLVLIYVSNELNVNREFVNYNRLFRVISYQKSTGNIMALTLKDLGPLLKSDLTGLDGVTRITRIGTKKIIHDGKEYPVKSMYVDDDYFPMFENKSGISSYLTFTDPYSVVISKSLAKRIFNSENVMGQSFTINVFDKMVEVTVGGLFNGYGKRSTFDSELIASMDLYLKHADNPIFEVHPWYNTFIQLSKSSKTSEIIKLIDGIDNQHFDGTSSTYYNLQSFSDFYLDSGGISNHFYSTGDKNKIQLFITISLLLLITATVNYNVLSTAIALNRKKEFGIRKSFGANQSNLRWQALIESLVLAVIALPLAIITVELLLPYANQYWEKSFYFDVLQNWQITTGFLILTILVGISSGAYLSFYITKLNPILIIYPGSSRSKGNMFRKSLFVVQLFIFISLTSFSIVVLKQIDYFLNKPMGYDVDNFIVFNLDNKNLRDMKNPPNLPVESFLNEAREYPGIASISFFTQPPPPYQDNTGSQGVTTSRNPNQMKIMLTLSGDYRIIETMGLEIIEGRDLRENVFNEVLLTEKAAKNLELEIPLGEVLQAGMGGSEVVGIVKDFHIQSFRRDIAPLLIRQYPLSDLPIINRLNFGVRCLSENEQQVIEVLTNKFKTFFPDFEITYSSQKERLKSLYANEWNVAETMILVTFLTLIILVMGLFAISVYEAERRTREIGIRKVNGASIGSIIALLFRDFSRWVAVAFILSCPISIFAINLWLQGFVYQTNISWWVLLVAGASALSISWLSISYQSYRVARKNPVDTLRYE